ncbi:MAG: DUF5676 family membrane protein [Pirellulaceae bacterium]
MNRISIPRFGLGLGVASALFYLGCVLTMLVLPHEAVVRVFNSLMHGLDVQSLMRWEIPWWESVLGVVGTFVLGWLFGALVAIVYNLGLNRPGGDG